MVSFWWIYRYGGYDGKPASHILLSQRPYPKEKQVINLDQDVQVCWYFWWMVDETPLYDFSLPCNIFGMGYIFSSFFCHALEACGIPSLGMYLFFLFFDMPCAYVAYLLWVCIFYFFLYSPYISCNLERDSHGMSQSFICGWMGDVLAIFQCRSIACEYSCTWSWSWAYEVVLSKGHNNLTKLNEKISCICRKGFSNL